MTDRDALLAAVRAASDDDLPRLVYADWLEEHGDPDRAAFIRHQVEAARAERYSPAWRAATYTAEALLARHRDEWTDHLRGAVYHAEFARGFVERVAVEPVAFPDAAAGLFAAEPVRAVRLAERDRDPLHPPEYEVLTTNLFDVPELQHVRALAVGPGAVTTSADLDDLVRSPHLHGLADLSLAGNRVDPPWLTEFLAGERLPNLSGLDLSDITNLGRAVAEGLAGANHRRLLRLDLSGVRLLWDELQRVLSARCLRTVEELRLGRAVPQGSGPAGHLNLGWLVPWGRLRVLDLAGQGVGNEGCREIARTPAAGSLRWLGLAANHLGPAAADALAGSPDLDLYHLDVRGNGLAPADVAALRDRFPEAVVLA